MKIFDKKNTALIEDEDLNDAKLSVSDFTEEITKKRAFADIIGARLAMKLFFANKIEASNLYSLYTIHSVLEDIDIADIYYNGIKIDIRLIFNQNEIFIPKSHFQYDMLPDLYAVIMIQEDLSSVGFLGFFEPKDIDKKNANKDFYFFEYEKLIKPDKLKTFLDSFEAKNNFNETDENFEGADELFLTLIDKDISEKDKRFLYKKLAANFTLREKLVEFENFETISKETVAKEICPQDGLLDVIGAQQLFKDEEANESEEDLKKEIYEQMLADSDDSTTDDEFAKEVEEVLGERTKNKEKTDNSKLATNIAIGGAIVAGTAAAASAAAAASLSAQTELAKDSGAALAASAQIANTLVDGVVKTASNSTELGQKLLKNDSVNSKTEDSDEFLSEKEYEDLLNETEEYLSSKPDTNDITPPKAVEDISEDDLDNLKQTLENQDNTSNNDTKDSNDNEFSSAENELDEENVNINADEIIAKGLNALATDELMDVEGEFEELPKLESFDKLINEDGLSNNVAPIDEEPTNNIKLDDLEPVNIELENTTETTQDDNLVSLEDFLNEEEEQKQQEKDQNTYDGNETANTQEEEEESSSQDSVSASNSDDELLAKFRELEEEENTEEILPQEDSNNNTPIEKDDDFIAELDNFINDAETSSETKQKVAQSVSALGETSDENLPDDSSDVVFFQKADEETEEEAAEAANATPENNDLLKALFEKEKLANNDETAPLEKKFNFDFAKNKKMVIAASVASVVIGSMIISGAVINSHNRDTANLANKAMQSNQIPENTQQNPDGMNENGQTQQNMGMGSNPNMPQGMYGEKSQNEALSPDMGRSMSNTFQSEPVNASVSKVAWEVPEDLAYNDSFRKYLQIAGRSLKLNLQNNLLLATEMAYSNKVIVDLAVDKGGNLQAANISASSGSKQIDGIVLQSVKETLKYLKMPADELVGQSAVITLIINF